MEYAEATKKFGSSTENRFADQKHEGKKDAKRRAFVLGFIVGILVGAFVLWMAAADRFEDFRATTDREMEELKSAHSDRVSELGTTIEHLEAEVIGLRERCLVFDDEPQRK